jgi:hypothetical protein
MRENTIIMIALAIVLYVLIFMIILLYASLNESCKNFFSKIYESIVRFIYGPPTRRRISPATIQMIELNRRMRVAREREQQELEELEKKPMKKYIVIENPNSVHTLGVEI